VLKTIDLLMTGSSSGSPQKVV